MTSDAAPWQSALDSLAHAPEAAWLEQGRAWMLQGRLDGAMVVFAEAARHFPASTNVLLGLAGLHWQRGERTQAEARLRDWLASRPGDEAATFLLMQFLREQGRLQAATEVVHQFFAHGPHSDETVTRAVEVLDDYGRPKDAAAICEAAIAAGSTDAGLHAYAGMLAAQLGEFDRARVRYRYALDHHPDAVNWNIPLALAGLQRYADATHPDLALFRQVLERSDLPASTRTATLFALGKAYDDLGEQALAADALRQANAAVHAHSRWSRKLWKRSVEARLAAPRSAITLEPATDWTPIFVVGVPRSGTTLLARLLAHHAGVCNRGELGWLDVAVQRLSLAPAGQRQPLEEAAALYAAQLRQDDTEARWFIDKQPLNLLHVDLIMAMWPHARIIVCQRGPRDTALSLWSQSFHDAAHDYAYDFDDIAALMQGCARLAAHWLMRYPNAVRSVRYEELVASPDASVAALLPWLGLPSSAAVPAAPSSGDDIRTASAWQARQPVYTRSAGRWRAYAPYLPELLKFPEH